MKMENNLIDTLLCLEGRTALVTGGAGHLGRVIAKTLHSLGASVIIADHFSSERNSAVLNKFNLEFPDFVLVDCDLECDIARSRLIKKIENEYKNLYVLVNAAAFTGASDLEGWSCNYKEQSLATWKRAIEVNLTAPFHLCRDLAKVLLENEGSSIINIGSIYAHLAPDWSIYDDTNMGNPFAYGASKAGLNQMTRYFSTALAPNVRVNSINPGGILRNQNQQFINKYESKTPMRRMATENDFIGAIAFLASDMSKYITGITLNVDGGWGVW